MDYYREVSEKLNIYQKKYIMHPRVVMLKMSFLNMIYALKLCFARKECMKRDEQIINNNVTLAMITSGGIGDHLLFANYVYCFQNYFQNNIVIDVFFKDKFSIAENIFHENDICRSCYEYADLNNDNYDVVMDLAGFPKIEKCNIAKLQQDNLQLLNYVEKCKEYKEYCRSAFRGNAYGMMRLCELEGRKLIQRGDIYNILGITEEYAYPLFIDENEDKYLQACGLQAKRFITIQTGCDVIYDSHVKQWPIENYKKLVQLIHIHYSDLTIVQIGNSGKECGSASEILNMLKKTSLEQVKVLLKHSLIHIDIEGGMVHLRHALRGGISIVLFGPTPISFFGYEENCNISSGICNMVCYQMTNSWPQKCPKTGSAAMCMECISPEEVFSKFEVIVKSFGFFN